MTTTKKNVLQLCHSYNTPFLDVARQYASLFKQSGYRVITVYLTGKNHAEVAQQSNSEIVIFLENDSSELRGLKRKQIKQIKSLQQKYKFHFAIAHRFKSIFIASHINNLPVMGIHHAFDVYRGLMRRLYVNRRKKNLFLIGVSNAVTEDIRKALPNFPSQQIQTLYNRIDPELKKSEHLSRSQARTLLGLEQNQFIYASIGRLHKDKDHATLIAAFNEVARTETNCILVLMGSGPLESSLKEHVQKMQLQKRILFLGHIDNASQYYKAFDCFILASSKEPFGMVLLEAIVASVPVITTNSGGAKEVLTDINWLFDSGNQAQLTKLMYGIRSLSEAEKQQIIERNKTHLHHNFTDTVVQKTFWSLPFFDDINSEEGEELS